MTLTTFESLLANVTPNGQNAYQAVVNEDWLQGRSAFGGLSGALIAQAMRQQVDAERKLRSFQVTFVGPAGLGDHNIVMTPLREGGSVTHLQAELTQGDEVSVTATAAYGKSRVSEHSIAPIPRPDAVDPDTLKSMPFMPGIVPNFVQHFDFRWAIGSPPFTGAAKPNNRVWIRMDSDREIDEVGIIAMADALPPPALSMPKKPCPASSLSWYLELLPMQAKGKLSDWWLVDYDCDAGADGYYNQVAKVWAPDGQLVAISRQVAVMFG